MMHASTSSILMKKFRVMAEYQNLKDFKVTGEGRKPSFLGMEA
jgi:hypothetical protein